MPRSPLAPIALLLAACSAADAREALVRVDSLPGGIPVLTTAAPIDSGRWSLVHERDVQPAPGAAGELGNPQDIAIGDDGTLVVSETGPAVVHVYGPDGAFVRDIGREGDGPGEFRAPFIGIRGDTLVVQDPRTSRATTFRLGDGSVVATRPTVCCYYSPIGIDADGEAVARMMSLGDSTPSGQGFVRFPIGGTTAESLVVHEHPDPKDAPRWTIGDGKQMMMMMAVPMQPRSWHAFAPSGEFVTGWAGEYRLWRTRNGRDTLRVFGRPWTARAVTDEERSRIVETRVTEMLGNGMGLKEEQLRKSMDPAAIPATRPAFEGVWADGQGRTWVRLSSPDTAAVHLDLFDPEGRWLDQLTVEEPEWANNGYVPLAFSRDRLAILGEDEDGLPIVRIFRITRKE